MKGATAENGSSSKHGGDVLVCAVTTCLSICINRECPGKALKNDFRKALNEDAGPAAVRDWAPESQALCMFPGEKY